MSWAARGTGPLGVVPLPAPEPAVLTPVEREALADLDPIDVPASLWSKVLKLVSDEPAVAAALKIGPGSTIVRSDRLGLWLAVDCLGETAGHRVAFAETYGAAERKLLIPLECRQSPRRGA
jgi:hypothetical protein